MMNYLSALPLMTLSIALGTTISVQAIEGDAERGQLAASTCMACHQADGSGMSLPGSESWPRLAGLDAGYLYKQLQDFNEGHRENATMAPFAAMLTDQQMRDISIYYSELPAVSGTGTAAVVDDAMLVWGETLATQGDWSRYIPSCQSCHGPDNQGAGRHFPALAGQHAGYLQAQLQGWQQQRRRNDPQHLMLAIAERMNAYDIEAVAAWLSIQPSQ